MQNYEPKSSKILYLNKVYLLYFYFQFISYYIYHPFVDDSSCYDTLEIKGLETKIFCGTTLPAPYTPKSNVVKLVVTSDDTVQRAGFDLTFTTVTSMLTYKHPLQPK